MKLFLQLKQLDQKLAALKLQLLPRSKDRQTREVKQTDSKLDDISQHVCQQESHMFVI